MKMYFPLLLSAALLTVTGCEQPSPTQTGDTPAGAPASPPGEVVATVNGTVITQPVLQVYMQIRNAQKPGKPADRDSALDEIVSLELMRQEGISNGLGNNPMVMATLDQQMRTVLASAAIKDFLAKNPVTDEAAKQLYDEQVGGGEKEYSARHILLKTREEAVDVIGQLDAGGDFETLAREKSIGPSGKNGGKLGWFSPAQMVKPFSDATAQLEKGSYTREPVQTQFGWHVILLEDVRDVTPPSFDDVKDQLKLLLANQMLQAHIQELRTAASIEIATTGDAAPADAGAGMPEDDGTGNAAGSPDTGAEEAPAAAE